MTKIPTSKKAICFILVIIFLGLFLVNIGEARANVLEDAAGTLLQGIFYIFLQIARAFTAFAGNIFTMILKFGFEDMTVVKSGWTITRDIVNMLFIFGLVVIAFATILRIETYGIKTLLPKLIIIALLINFSYLVCGIIIDTTQIMTEYFISQIKTDDVGLAVLDSLHIEDAMKGSAAGGATVEIGGPDPRVATITTMAFTAGVVFLTGIILLIGAVLLFVRIGALWVLIILAPFAWLFSVFPVLKAQSSKWWSEFFKYSFFAPIYVFFIYLVIRISKEMELIKLSSEEVTASKSLLISVMFQTPDLMFKFAFLVILLLGAPVVAMSMGIHGSKAVMGFGKKLYKIPLKGAGTAIKAVQKSLTEMFWLLAALVQEPLERPGNKEEKKKRPKKWNQQLALGEIDLI